ncbi:MAG: winged helix DNA-binding domain-containing protein [Methanobacterium sp.]
MAQKTNIPIMRLQSQQLDCQRFKKPEEIIAWFSGIQAQDYPGAKWAIAQRLEDCTNVNIEQAFAEKKFVRTWAMRGTLHFVAASDIRWMLELLSPRIIARNARRYKELELDEETLKRSNEVLKNALKDGKRLNRRELVTILQENGISTEGQRTPYMLQRASLDGLICQGGMHSNNNPIFISMGELPKTKTLTRHNALAELARRYFTSHGPATIQDFTWWSGLLTKDAKAGLEAVKSQLESVTIGDKIYWYSGSKQAMQHSSTRVHLLPSFDEYLVGYKDRSAILEKMHSKNTSIENIMYPTISIDGQIVGTWKRRFNKNEVMVELKPSIGLKATEGHILDEAAHRFGEFLEMPVHTSIIS